MAHPDQPAPIHAARAGIRIALAYALIASAWIYFSDQVLEWIIPDASRQNLLQTFKGLAFVAATAYLLFLAVRLSFRWLEAARRQAELNERRLRQLLETTNEGVWVADFNRTTIYANERMAHMLGTTVKEMTGRSSLDFLFEEDRAPSTDRMEHRRNGLAEVYDARLRRVDGTELWVLASTAPLLDESGKPSGSIGMVTDITERRRAEQALRDLNVSLEQRVLERTAELQAANEALDAFASSVSHDLQRPLASIQRFAIELAEKWASSLDDSGRELLLRIAGASARMNSLVNEVLDFAREIPAETSLERLSLVLLVNDVVGQIERELGRGKADIIISEPMPWVLGRRFILLRVLSNLLTNAVTYVAVGVRPSVRIWCEHRDGVVRLWMEDNGIGIDPAQEHELFEVSSSRSGPRSGMGLAVVKLGVERMGGRVGVEPNAAQGSRFWIELRVAPELPTEPTSAKVP